MTRRVMLALTVAGVLAAAGGSRAVAARPKGASAKEAPATVSAAQRMARARQIMGINGEAMRHFKAGRLERCKDLLNKILKIDPGSGLAHYNLACVYTAQKKLDQAVRELNTALDKGYSSFGHMERDPDLDALRRLPGYKKVLSRRGQIQRERAGKILAGLKKRFGEGFICEIDHDSKLVFATDVDRRTLNELQASLSAYAAAQWRTLFSNRFDQYVTVVIPRDASMIPRGIGGLFDPRAKQLTAKSIGMVLTHEFTHALHFADQEARGQRHAIWVTEGLATLFESSHLVAGVPTPIPNQRSNAIKYLVQRKRHIPWSTFFALSHRDFMGKAATAYPQGRYIFMYLHEKGLLRKWYDAYTAGYATDKTGAKAIAQVVGKPLGEIEADWLKWIGTGRGVPRRLAPKQAYIGVQLAKQADGLRILRVVPGSAAANAGLKPDDVITKLDGRRMVDVPELLRTVTSHRVGDKVKIEYRRGGTYATVTATLGAVPDRLAPAPRPKPKPQPQTRPAKKKAA